VKRVFSIWIFCAACAVFAVDCRAQLIPGLPQIVFDPTNHGVNAANLAQMEQLYQTMLRYRQFFETAQGMFKCPTCFMYAASNAVDGVIGIMVANGNLDPSDPATQRKITDLKKVMSLGQIAMQQSQIGRAMSTGNGASIGLLTIQMAQLGQQINDQMNHFQMETQANYYASRSHYVPMAQQIKDWRLK
jgi:hypothetical protein